MRIECATHIFRSVVIRLEMSKDPAEQKKVFALTWQNCDEKVCLHLQYIGLHQCSKIFDELNAYFFAFFKF